MKKTFDRFYRGDASRSISGNDLGLALVKSIAQRHNGTVSVSSDEKKRQLFCGCNPQLNGLIFIFLASLTYPNITK